MKAISITLIFLLLVSCSEITKTNYDVRGEWYYFAEVDSVGNIIEKYDVQKIVINDSTLIVKSDINQDGKYENFVNYRDDKEIEIDVWKIKFSGDTIYDEGGYSVYKHITKDSLLVKFHAPEYVNLFEEIEPAEIWWEVWGKTPPKDQEGWVEE